MDNENTDSILDKWAWNKGPVIIMTALPILISIILAIIQKSPYFLFISLAGIFAGAVYGTVGKKVATLREEANTQEGDAAESLIVNGIIQSPGIAIMKSETIELIPIVGKAVTVNISEILEVKETKFFNGKSLIGKSGFWVRMPGKARIGFAIPNPVAQKWRPSLLQRR